MLPPLKLALSCTQDHLAHAASVVASVCRRTRRAVHARVDVLDGDLPQAFQAGNLTVEFAHSPQPLNDPPTPGVDAMTDGRIGAGADAIERGQCWVLSTDQLIVGDLGEMDCCRSQIGFVGDFEWGRVAAQVIDWTGAAKPWDDPSLPGAQLWLRELTDWEELKHELIFRDRDRHKVPAFLIHLTKVDETSRDTAEALEDGGFALELVRGCDPAYPLQLRGSVGLFLEWFGWQATRSNMARVLSHRWAWLAFLQQSDAPYAVVCEDGIVWKGTEAEIREMGDGRGDGSWLVDLAGETGGRSTGWKPVCHDRPEAYPPDGRAYCLSREAARLLLERDYCNARALVEPHDPIAEMSVETSGRTWATGPSALESPNSKPEAAATVDKVLVGICSCRAYVEKRQAVRDTWFPRGVPGLEAVFFVGDGESEFCEPDTVCVAAPDTYHDLPAKVLGFFRYVLEHYDFDWLFKCDDDTYLAVERLHCLLEHEAEHVGNYFVKTRGAADGGAGYLLSRRLVEDIAADASLALTGPEDVIIGEAAIATGASHASDGRLIRTVHPMPRWDNHLITCHRLSPRDLRTVHALMEPPHNLIEVRGEHGVEDHILLHRDNRYSLKTARETGTYEWRKEVRQLVLHLPHQPPTTLDIAAGNIASSLAAARSGQSTLWSLTVGEFSIVSQRNPGDLSPTRIHVSHASWWDQVDLFDDGRFSRVSADDGGSYSRLPDAIIHRWDQWEPERFVRMPDAADGTEHYCLDRVAKSYPVSATEENGGRGRKFHAVSSGWLGPVTLLESGSLTEGREIAGSWLDNEDGGITLLRQGRPASRLIAVGAGYQGDDYRLYSCATSYHGMWRDFDPGLAIYRKLSSLGLNVASPWGDCAIPCGCRWDLLLSGENIEVKPDLDGFAWNAWGLTGTTRLFVGPSKIASLRAFHLPHFYDYWSRYAGVVRTVERPQPGISFVASNTGPRRRLEVARQLARWFPLAVSSGLRRHFADLPDVTVADVPTTLTGKLDFIAKFTFNLCFENEIANGYLTEKPFQALWAGAMPIYEGDPDVASWLDPSALVDCSGLDASDIADRIREAEKAGIPEWIWTEREKLVKISLEEMTGRFEDFLDAHLPEFSASH